MNLKDAVLKQEYTIRSIETRDDELNSFLFSLGCYSGEKITVVKQNKNGCIVLIKDARYSLDKNLASVISIE
jgi:ferrous iron transport protein A